MGLWDIQAQLLLFRLNLHQGLFNLCLRVLFQELILDLRVKLVFFLLFLCNILLLIFYCLVIFFRGMSWEISLYIELCRLWTAEASTRSISSFPTANRLHGSLYLPTLPKPCCKSTLLWNLFAIINAIPIPGERKSVPLIVFGLHATSNWYVGYPVCFRFKDCTDLKSCSSSIERRFGKAF